MSKILWFLMGFLMAAVPAMAGSIPEPSATIQDKQLLFYLRNIRDQWENITVVASDPNGSRKGRKGDVVIWNDSGTYRWRVNTSQTPGTGTTWSSITS